jgi:hypothetical protein
VRNRKIDGYKFGDMPIDLPNPKVEIRVKRLSNTNLSLVVILSFLQLAVGVSSRIYSPFSLVTAFGIIFISIVTIAENLEE